jgi:hypothetical protein
MTRRQAVDQPQEHTEHTDTGLRDAGYCGHSLGSGAWCHLLPGHDGDHDPQPQVADTTQQVAAISQPAEILSLELEKRIQKVKLQHHALQRRMSPPAGIPAVVKKP